MRATKHGILKEIERLKAEIMSKSIVINDIIIKERKYEMLEVKLLDKDNKTIKKIVGNHYAVFIDMKLIYYGLM